MSMWRPGSDYLETVFNSAYRSQDRGESWPRIKGYNFK